MGIYTNVIGIFFICHSSSLEYSDNQMRLLENKKIL